MKFFEYPAVSDYYYALIAADSIEQANKLLSEKYCDVGEEAGRPREISESEALNLCKKYANVSESDFHNALTELPRVLLIDGELV